MDGMSIAAPAAEETAARAAQEPREGAPREQDAPREQQDERIQEEARIRDDTRSRDSQRAREDADEQASDADALTERERRLADALNRERDESARRELDRQVREARDVYPGLDLRVEARDPRFRRLMRAGLTVREAFEGAHHQDITRAAVSAAERRARAQERGAVSDLRARAEENGLAQTRTGRLSADVLGLSRKERDDIERRALRGERILF